MAQKQSNRYVEAFSSGQRKRRKSSGRVFLARIFDTVISVAWLTASVLIIVSLLTPYFHPEESGVISVISLAAPIYFLLHIIFTLYWIFRRKKVRAILSVILFTGCLFPLNKYYVVKFKRTYEQKRNERAFIHVVTYNTSNLDSQSIVDSVKSLKPDILCIQEFAQDTTYNRWNGIMKGSSTVLPEDLFACAVFTKYPIINQGEVPSLNRATAIWVDILLPSDTVRVVNVHLNSTRINGEETSYINSHKYIFDNNREEKFKEIVVRLRDNNIGRAYQADSLSAFLKASPHPLIVCGDFNDIPLSYTYRNVRGDLKDCFSEAATGYDYTFSAFFRMLRIDNIFVSGEFHVETYNVRYDLKESDHYPVVARLKIDK